MHLVTTLRSRLTLTYICIPLTLNQESLPSTRKIFRPPFQMEKKIKVMIDTGANFSAINSRVALTQGLKIQKHRGFAIIGHGSRTKLFGYTTITLFHGTHAFKVKCAVIRGLPSTIIFGMDQLKKRNAMISLQGEMISMLDDKSVMVTMQVSTTSSGDSGNITNDLDTHQVRCNEEIVVPANCNMMVYANIRKISSGDAIASNLTGTQLLVEMDDKARVNCLKDYGWQDPWFLQMLKEEFIWLYLTQLMTS